MSDKPRNLTKSISVVGCGWLGLPLALKLSESYEQVLGSTTSDTKLKTLQGHGIIPFQLQSEDDITDKKLSPLFNSDVLILTIPPQRRNPEFTNHYPDYLKQIISRFLDLTNSDKPEIYYTSSTSVYGDITGDVDESTPAEPVSLSGEAIREVEQYLSGLSKATTTILRLGGLYGPDRHPVRYLAGRSGVSNGKDPVNLVHQQDIISVVAQLLDETLPKPQNQLINIVCPDHPTKEEYYTIVAKQLGIEQPSFKDEGGDGKCVHPKYLKKQGFSFRCPSPFDGIVVERGEGES